MRQAGRIGGRAWGAWAAAALCGSVLWGCVQPYTVEVGGDGAGGSGGAAVASGQERGGGAPADPVATSLLRERAIELLQEAALSESPQVRANALEALEAAPSRLAPLVAGGLKDPNLGVRSVAAMMVGRAELCELAPSVRPLLRDGSGYVRASAMYALRACGEEVDLSPLARILLRDPSPRVRAHAAFVLGELGNPSAVGLLRDAVRAEMARAAESEVRLLRLQIAESMVKLGDLEQLQTISAALYPSSPGDLEATALAAQMLGQLGARSMMDHLIYLTAQEGRGTLMPAEVRLAAAASLAQLGQPQGAFIADEYAGDESVVLRMQSAYVYGQTGRAEVLEKLAGLMEDPSPLVAVAAAAGVLEATRGEGVRASSAGG